MAIAVEWISVAVATQAVVASIASIASVSSITAEVSRFRCGSSDDHQEDNECELEKTPECLKVISQVDDFDEIDVLTIFGQAILLMVTAVRVSAGATSDRKSVV